MILRDSPFWRNATIVGAAHVAVLIGLARWSERAKKQPPSDIVWMEGGATAALQTVAATAPASEEVAVPPPPDAAPPEQQELVPNFVRTDLPLPTPTPSATATPTPRPTATPTPSATPKAAPKLTPKPTPKKTLLAKASPKATATPVEKKTARPDAPKKQVEVAAAPTPSAGDTTSSTPTQATSSGTGGRGSGPGGASQHGWYAKMLHDKFFGEWVQPMSAVATGARMSTLVRIRIEKDGRISSFTIVRPSGNVVVDESVLAVAKRVAQVDPLPNGVGNGTHYDVNINFALDVQQDPGGSEQ